MKKLSWFVFFCSIAATLMTGVSCKHSPATLTDDVVPVDTTSNPVDTIGNGIPCDPDVVYFELDILPILVSRCAFSGCHNAASAEDGVVLESYESVMQTADVRPYDLDGSDLYEVITDNDPDDRMPRPPNAPLSAEQKNLIADWIMQGAKNLECDPDAGGCNTENVSFAQYVRPVIQNSCQGCHSGSVPSGNIDLTTYDNVRNIALSGRLYGAISWQNNYENMPFGGNKLPDCSIDKIKSWIDSGAPNN